MGAVYQIWRGEALPRLPFEDFCVFIEHKQALRTLKQSARSTPAWLTLALFCAVFVAWSMTGVLFVQGRLPAGAAFVLNTLWVYLNFTVLHEAAHGNIRGEGVGWRRVETLVGWCSGMLLTIPFPVFRLLHLKHHAHTNHPEKDPDYWVAAGQWWQVGLKSMSIIVGYYWHFVHFFPRQANAREKKYIWQSVLGFAAVYAVTFLSVPLHWGWEVLVLWWGPALLASGILALVFNWLPHHPHQTQDKYLHTRIFLRRGLTPVLMAQNYHLIHHLHPGLPFYLYPRAFRLLVTDLRSRNCQILGRSEK